MTIKWPLNLYRELLFAELFHNQYCRLSIGVFLSSFTSKTNASLRGPSLSPAAGGICLDCKRQGLVIDVHRLIPFPLPT